jgi:HK97 family phage major capsid protein
VSHQDRARRRTDNSKLKPALPQAGVRAEPTNDDSTARIGIYGEIGFDVTAEDVSEAVAMAKGKPLTVDIFSFGGSAFEGLAIYQVLSAHDAEVTTNVLGVAASAASVIAMAGDRRIVPENAALMIHQPYSLTIGDASEHRKSAAMLDGLSSAYLHTYAAATGIPASEIKPYLDEERWMYGQEAMALGFATEAPEPIKAFASIAPPPADRFRQIPDDLKAMAGISVEVSVEITDPADPADSPEDPELEVSGPPDAVLELMAKTADPIPATMTSLSTEQPTPPTAALPMTVETTQADAALAERERIQSIQGMVAAKGLPDEFALELVNSGKSVAEARHAVLDRLPGVTRHSTERGAVASLTASGIDLSEKDCKVYSLQNVFRHLAEPTNAAYRNAIGFEMELHDELQRNHARSAAGVLVPHNIFAVNARPPGFRPQAVQRTDNFSAGGALVASERLDGQFVDLLRNMSAFMRTGITVLNGLSGNVEISKQTGPSATFWVGEGGDVTESDLSYGLVNMSPKTLGARVAISRRALIQTSPDIENLNRNDVLKQIGLGIDKAIGYGTGSSSQPLGLKGITGVGGVTFSGGKTATFNTLQGGGTGSCGTWEQWVQLETELSSVNIEADTMVHLFNGAMRGGLKTTLRDSVAGADYIFTDDKTVNGYGTIVSNQIQSNDAFFGDWPEALLGFWSGVDLVVDPYTRSSRGEVVYTAFQDTDFGVRRPEAFVIGS